MVLALALQMGSVFSVQLDQWLTNRVPIPIDQTRSNINKNSALCLKCIDDEGEV